MVLLQEVTVKNEGHEAVPSNSVPDKIDEEANAEEKLNENKDVTEERKFDCKKKVKDLVLGNKTARWAFVTFRSCRDCNLILDDYENLTSNNYWLLPTYCGFVCKSDREFVERLSFEGRLL